MRSFEHFTYDEHSFCRGFRGAETAHVRRPHEKRIRLTRSDGATEATAVEAGTRLFGAF